MKTVRFEEMLPHQMVRELSRNPVLFMPLGTLEWHGVHNCLGLDAVKVHEICLRIARATGGVVSPPNYWAVGGVQDPFTFHLQEESELGETSLVATLLPAVYREFGRLGFKAVLSLTGHYGVEQQYVVKRAALRATQQYGVPVFAAAEYELAMETGYSGDHAASGETSLMMYLRPDLVDMSKLPKGATAVLQGVSGDDPRIHASKAYGRKIVAHIVKRASDLSGILVALSGRGRNEYTHALATQVDLYQKSIACGASERYQIIFSLSRDVEYVDACRRMQTGDWSGAVRGFRGVMKKLAATYRPFRHK